VQSLAANFTPATNFTAAGGTVQPGGSLTINRSAYFGTGPNVVVYADFHTGGEIDTIIPLTDTVVGQWTQYGTSPTARKAVYRAGRDGGKSAGVGNSVVANVAYFCLKDLPPFTECFASFDFYTGPFYNPDPQEKFVTAANLKYVWIHGDYTLPTNADRILNTQTYTDPADQHTYITGSLYGNSGPTVVNQLYLAPRIEDYQWDFYGWTRHELWMQTDLASPWTNTSKAYVGRFTKDRAVLVSSASARNFIETSTQAWDMVLLPGLFSAYTYTNTIDYRYDDIYFATGPGSAKRFVITDADTMAASRETYICYASAQTWTDNGVTVSIPYMQVGSSLAGKYLHYFNADNVSTLVGQFT
jgi:hypothetical protein